MRIHSTVNFFKNSIFSKKSAAFIVSSALLLALNASSEALSAPGSSVKQGRYSGSSSESALYYTEVMPNGMRVILSEDYNSAMCSVNIFCKVGGFEETIENMGISHFFEHLFFRGTPSLSGYQFKRAIEAVGGVTNATTGQDFTHYFINLPAKNALKGMALLADALKNAEMSQEAIDQERNAVLEEYRMDLESPVRTVNGMLCEMAYGDHPYSRQVIGTESNIRSFNRSDFIKFRDTYISPERITVVVTGDFRRGEMLSLIHKELGSFERPKKRIISDFAPIKPPKEEVYKESGVPSDINFSVLGFIGPSVKDKPDIYTVDVMSFLMGVGRGSLIQKKLVKTGKIKEGGVQFMTQRFPGLITLYGVNPCGSKSDVKKELLEVIADVKAGRFTDRDIRRAKAFLKSNYVTGLDTCSGYADNLGFYASIDSVKFVDDYLDKIDRVSREDIINAADKYFGSGYYHVLLKGTPRKKNVSDSESRDK